MLTSLQRNALQRGGDKAAFAVCACVQPCPTRYRSGGSVLSSAQTQNRWSWLSWRRAVSVASDAVTRFFTVLRTQPYGSVDSPSVGCWSGNIEPVAGVWTTARMKVSMLKFMIHKRKRGWRDDVICSLTTSPPDKIRLQPNIKTHLWSLASHPVTLRLAVGFGVLYSSYDLLDRKRSTD